MKSITWQSPSNIALVKYWGKRGNQLPSNPSLSFTLDECHTTTQIRWEKGSGKTELLFNGERLEKFTARASAYILSLGNMLPFLAELDLHIDSKNNFPHSAGIASSASAMSSLALCLCSLEEEVTGTRLPEEDFFRKASLLARLGSGSASRSVYGGFVSWGASPAIDGSSDEYASPLSGEVHEHFRDMRDTILVVDRGTKAVSSSAGHRLMDQHPYAAARFEQARIHFSALVKVLEEGDDDRFIHIVETEALNLHALMMSSDQAYILLRAETLKVIEKIRAFRESSGIPICFTLDAGPNVHLLYHGSDINRVGEFIKQELLLYCSDKYRIDDRIGDGPEKLEHRG